MCLIKIFTLATLTFEEQHRHITGLQHLSIGLLHKVSSLASTGGLAMLGLGGSMANMRCVCVMVPRFLYIPPTCFV
jgi:hypothetical protein